MLSKANFTLTGNLPYLFIFIQFQIDPKTLKRAHRLEILCVVWYTVLRQLRLAGKVNSIQIATYRIKFSKTC